MEGVLRREALKGCKAETLLSRAQPPLLMPYKSSGLVKTPPFSVAWMREIAKLKERPREELETLQLKKLETESETQAKLAELERLAA